MSGFVVLQCAGCSSVDAAQGYVITGPGAAGTEAETEDG
jgi:hypothetical protein